MTINGTIDTVSMQHLCRAPVVKVQQKKSKKIVLGIDQITAAMKEGRLILHADHVHGIFDEWKKTCGTEIIQQIVIQWEQTKNIKFCVASGAIRPAGLKQALKNAAFNDAGDKLLVRISLSAISTHAIPNFIIATSDGDFWDPSDHDQIGDESAVVCAALMTQNVTPKTLDVFLTQIA